MACLLRDLGMSHEEFQERCGLGGGFVSRVSLMTRKSSFDKIKSAFPRVNINWVLTGNGEMYGEEPMENAQPLGERLHAFALSLGMNDRQFERAANLSNGYMNKPIRSITPKTRLLLSERFPYLNLDWLLTGAGEMTSGPQAIVSTISVKDRLKHYISEIGIGESRFLSRCGLTAKRVDQLPKAFSDDVYKKISTAYPTLSMSWLKTGTGVMECEHSVAECNDSFAFVPLVLAGRQAEYAMRYRDSAFLKSLPSIPVPKTDGNTIAFEVVGDAMNNGMANGYLDGDKVVCREVTKGHVMADQSLIKKRDFAVVTSRGVEVSTIKECDTTALSVTIHPLNPNSRWSDDTIPLQNVGQIFVVEWVVRKK